MRSSPSEWRLNTITARRELNYAEKRAIALEARKLVQPGQRLLLDSGTTALEFATLPKDVKGLTTALGRKGSPADVDILITEPRSPRAHLKHLQRLGPKISAFR